MCDVMPCFEHGESKEKEQASKFPNVLYLARCSSHRASLSRCSAVWPEKLRSSKGGISRQNIETHSTNLVHNHLRAHCSLACMYVSRGPGEECQIVPRSSQRIIHQIMIRLWSTSRSNSQCRVPSFAEIQNCACTELRRRWVDERVLALRDLLYLLNLHVVNPYLPYIFVSTRLPLCALVYPSEICNDRTS